MTDNIEKEIDKMFKAKLQSLQKSLTTIRPMLGKPVDTVVILPMFAAIVVNISDLYHINEIIVKSMIMTKKQLDSLDNSVKSMDNHKLTNIERQVDDMQKEFDKTFGSLSDVIDKINKRDKNGGDIYG